MLALDARFVARSRAGTRTIPASEFFTGILSTALEPTELLSAVEIPAARRHAPAPRSSSWRGGTATTRW